MKALKGVFAAFLVWAVIFLSWMVIGSIIVTPPIIDAEKTAQIKDLYEKLKAKSQPEPSIVQESTNSPNSVNLIQGDKGQVTINADTARRLSNDQTERIVSAAKVRVLCRAAERKFVHIRFADYDGAGSPQFGN